MQLVSWVGKPDHWTPPLFSGSAPWILTATEDALPAVVRAEDKRRISAKAALQCVDRYLLRRALSSDHNPEYSSFRYSPRVAVKAPASSGSSGVRLLDLTTKENDIAVDLRSAADWCPPLYGVVEEFIEGEAVELSGVMLAEKFFFFHPLRQRWSRDWARIERYERTFDHWWLYEETVDALRCIGLQNAAFCVEWRVTGYKRAKLIEINPRPGDDDKGYFDALWDVPMAEQIEQWAQEVYRAESPETAQAQAVATHG